MRTLTRLALLSVIAFTPTQTLGQNRDAIEFYREAYTRVAQNYRRDVRQYLPREHKRKLDQIVFRFSPSQNIFALAYRDANSRRTVDVSLGFLVFMENLVIGYAVTGEIGQEACYLYYLDAAARALRRNTTRLYMGQPLELVPFFAGYVRSYGAGCDSVSPRDLENAAALEFLPGGMDSILTVVLGHEVAHHLLDHLDGTGPRTPADSRRFETEADVWAIEHAFAVGVNPFPAMPLWAFFAAASGTDLGSELTSSHPLGVRRWVDALNTIIERMRTAEYRRRFGVTPKSELAEVVRIRDSIRELLVRLGLDS